jgi:putative transposase
VTVAAFVAAQRAGFGVPHAVACRALGVSQAWFYKWRGGDLSPRRARRAALAAVIGYLFRRHRGRYGSPRIWLDLREMGWRVSVNTVAALMAEQHLAARRGRRRRSLTRPDRSARKAPDLLQRRFDPPEHPDVAWVGDLTELPNDEGRFYLADVLDLHSRRCVGFAMGEHHDAALAKAALCMAIAIRGGRVADVIFHTDQGGEGGFNWSSQHLDRGGADGQAGGLDEGVDGQGADEVAGEAFASPRRGAFVLA